MLSKCSNPGCTRIFRYLHQGTVFKLDLKAVGRTPTEVHRSGRGIEYFWLCSDCASVFTLVLQGRTVVTRRLCPGKNLAAIGISSLAKAAHAQ